MRGLMSRTVRFSQNLQNASEPHTGHIISLILRFVKQGQNIDAKIKTNISFNAWFFLALLINAFILRKCFIVRWVIPIGMRFALDGQSSENWTWLISIKTHVDWDRSRVFSRSFQKLTARSIINQCLQKYIVVYHVELVPTIWASTIHCGEFTETEPVLYMDQTEIKPYSFSTAPWELCPMTLNDIGSD